MTPPIPPDELQRIQDDLYAGRKIDAIKRMRTAAGLDLKSAKDVVEELERGMRATTPEKFTAPPGGKGCAGLLIVALLVGGGTLLLAARVFAI